MDIPAHFTSGGRDGRLVLVEQFYLDSFFLIPAIQIAQKSLGLKRGVFCLKCRAIPARRN